MGRSYVRDVVFSGLELLALIKIAGKIRQNATILHFPYPAVCGCSGLAAVLDSRSTGRGFNSHPRFTADNLEQVADLLCAQANSAFYPERDGK